MDAKEIKKRLKQKSLNLMVELPRELKIKFQVCCYRKKQTLSASIRTMVDDFIKKEFNTEDNKKFLEVLEELKIK
jgi:hypothetical protein